MATTKAKRKVKKRTTFEEFMANSKITINNNMKDYSNDPFFVKKNKEATEFMKKIGLPKELRE